MSDAEHWNPKEHERQYFTHQLTGDRGYLVRREGRDVIRLDRGSHEDIRTYNQHDWKPDETYRPLTRMHLAAIAFGADRVLCGYVGRHEQARKEWLSLRDEERAKWLKDGPPGPVARKKLFDLIMSAGEELNGK